MTRKLFLPFAIVLLLALSACRGDDKNDNSPQEDTSLRSFDWDRSPDSILLRFDQIPGGETEAYVTNTIPPCTIWGDGRLVLVNYVAGDAEVLEARLSDTQIRDFVEDVIGYGFYSWEDDLIPASAQSAKQSIVLNLFSSPKTVESYGGWPNNSFELLLTQCQGLSPDRALVVPDGGWLTAYPITLDPNAIWQEWIRTMPFKIADVAASDTPCWVDGIFSANLWGYTRTISGVQVTERDATFEIALQVPSISRSSPPAPSDEQARCEIAHPRES